MFGVLDTPPLCCRIPNTEDMPCVSILTLSGAGSVKEEMVLISTQTFGWRSWSLLKERLTDVQIKESLRGAAQALTLMIPNTKEITAILNSSKRAQRVKKGPLGLGDVIV